nr:MAG TPA: hypothetical protein [Bacteriophage sp.]
MSRAEFTGGVDCAEKCRGAAPEDGWRSTISTVLAARENQRNAALWI